MVHGRISSRPPTGNDLVVCLGCGCICVFDPQLQLHPLTPAAARGMDQSLVLEAIAFSDHVLAGKARH